jgi:hypothetical protein
VGRERLAVASVPVGTNPKTRESRLFRSIPQFLRRSATTILRAYLMYHPLRVFIWVSLVLTVIGALPIVRFVYHYIVNGGQGHIQSLVLGGAVTTMGFVAFLFGLLADLVSRNRQLLETTLVKVRRMELANIDANSRDKPASRTAKPLDTRTEDALFSNLNYNIETLENCLDSFSR